MNFTYFRFTFINTIKKRPVWITWLLFLLTITAFLIILPAVANMSPLNIWANTTMAICQSFLGMTVALFTAVLAIHIFKDSNEEGTELIVISKPISRFNIVLTKFFVFAFFCILVNITCAVVTACTWFLPKSDPYFYWKLIVSTFIGNLVSFGVFGGISILLTVKFAKAGVIITDIMISLIFIIYQVLSLFVIPVPSKSISNHEMSAPSYIVLDRDYETGKYKEDGLVKFNNSAANLASETPNLATTWQDMKKYWTDEILKGDPTLALNITDFAGQISLSYLSVGLDEYSYRQACRMFSVSRFYNYDLVSPASPEIISGVENKKTVDWVYYDYHSEIIEDLYGNEIVIAYPTRVGISAIPPLSLNRLRGFETKIPVGYLRDKDHLLMDSDVFFEADQWTKYGPAFKIMYDTIFDYKYYKIPTGLMYWEYPAAWKWTTENLEHYYELVWACLTGHSTDEKYLGPNSPMKEYSQQFFDINNADDLNERFLQFKHYLTHLVIQDQKELFSSGPTLKDEKDAKITVLASQSLATAQALLGFKSNANNWYCLPDKEHSLLGYSILGDDTQAPDFTALVQTLNQLARDISEFPEEKQEEILTQCSIAKYNRLAHIYNNCCNEDEDYLFKSLDKPERTATRNGTSYTVNFDWVPYINTLLTPGTGHNISLFFYKTTPLIQYWIYAVAWAAISLGMMAGACVIYNKYDVK